MANSAILVLTGRSRFYRIWRTNWLQNANYWRKCDSYNVKSLRDQGLVGRSYGQTCPAFCCHRSVSGRVYHPHIIGSSDHVQRNAQENRQKPVDRGKAGNVKLLGGDLATEPQMILLMLFGITGIF